MKQQYQCVQKQEMGFSMITVLISIAFIGIMAMIVLSVSAIRFQIQHTTIKGKGNFYTAEKILEEIKAGLQQDVGEAMSQAYVAVLEEYEKIDGQSEESLDIQRQTAFKTRYIQIVHDRLEDDQNSEQYDLEKINSYVDVKKTIDSSKETVSVVAAQNNPQMKVVKGDSVTLQNIKVMYINEQGIASIIQTDIRIGIPDMTFPTPSMLPDLLNLVVVANQGMICQKPEGVSDSITTIQGNIYAGKAIELEEHTKVEITGGERIVSMGKMILDSFSSLNVLNKTSLWLEGIDVNSAQLKVNGSIYVADDLTVQKGNGMGSSIQIKGDYYGYGSTQSANQSYFHTIGLKYQQSGNAKKNSAIVINGKHTTLDLSEVNRLMVAGRSYISTNRNDDVDNEIVMGESVTIKGTQIAYLIPSSVIENGQGSNPMTYEQYEEAIQKGSVSIQLEQPIKEWNGKTLKQLGVDENNPYKTIFYPMGNGNQVVYLYLNFKTERDENKFFQWYYEDKTRQEQIKPYMDFYLNDDGIQMKQKNAFLRFITKGNVLRYSNEKGEVLSPQSQEDIVKEEVGYQNTWFALTRNMLPNFNQLEEEEKQADRQVYENLIDEKARDNMTRDHGKIEFESEGARAIVIDNQEEEFVIGQEEADTLRLCVGTGDIRIKRGVQFEGIIMTKGKLIVEAGASLVSKPEEAARLLQATNGQYKLALLFYHGDQYVLGNQIQQGGETEQETTYQLEDCITYENWKKR